MPRAAVPLPAPLRQARSARLWNTTTTHVPADNADLFKSYFPYIVNFVTQQGIDPRDAEDVAMAVLTKFIEHDVLHDFDPEHVTDHNGVIRKAVFRTFLSGFVKIYTRHHYDMQGKRARREPFSGDTVVVPSNNATWFDMNVELALDDHEDLHAELLASRIRERLADEPRRNAQDHCDLVALFDAAMQQFDTHGRVSPTMLGEHFGVSKNTAINWMKRLRPLVAEAMAA